MKKLLLATSFLVTGAGFAAAEVTLTGDGRMGIVFNGDDWNFSSRARVKFNLSGETDTGLSFGAGFRADQQGLDGTDADAGSKGSIWVSGAFGKIEMGDTVGAAEAVIGDLPEIGFTDLDGHSSGLGLQGANEGDFLTGDGGDGLTTDYNPSLLYTYTFDAFTVAASITDGKDATFVDDPADPLDTSEIAQAYALGFKYAAGNYWASLAYETIDTVAGVDPSAIWLGGGVDLNGTNISALYGSFDDHSVIDNEIGLGVTSAFNDVGVSAYVKQVNLVDGVLVEGDDKVTFYGVGASYDLGGGASVVGGIADSSRDSRDAIADLGLTFKF